jgi:hypothetical protein
VAAPASATCWRNVRRLVGIPYRLLPSAADFHRTKMAARVPIYFGVLPLHEQIIWLFVLAIPISSIAWTVTHEEIFREPREYCVEHSRICRRLLQRKFFYMFTCEYCFSHYVTIVFLALTGYKLLLDDWRGYVIALFALVWMANLYMSAFGRLRLVIKSERTEIELKEEQLNQTAK